MLARPLKSKSVAIILTVIAVVGISLRVAASRGWPLWQDEAETAINSLQVLDHGYPSDTFESIPLYENKSFIPSDNAKYAYASTNYIGSHFERNKGWLTYYYQAAFLKLFGLNPLAARLPFVALFGLSMYLVYWLGKKFFSQNSGLLAAGVYAVNYYSIVNERQGRYYSLEVLLALFCLVVFYNAMTTQRWRWYWLSGLGLALLFYTHVVAAVTFGVFFVASHGLHGRSLSRCLHPKLWASLALTLAAVMPWIILVRLWNIPHAFTGTLGPTIWALMIMVLAIAYATLRIFNPIVRSFSFRGLSPVAYLVLILLISLILRPFITPYESVGARLFIDTIPILTLLLVELGVRAATRPDARTFLFHSFTLSLFGIGIFFLLNDGIGRFDNRLYDSRWVVPAAEFIQRQDPDGQAPVFASYQHFPLMLMLDNPVDSLWPIRKLFFDAYPGTLYIVINRTFLESGIPIGSQLPYTERILTCQKNLIDQATEVYHCPPLPQPPV